MKPEKKSDTHLYIQFLKILVDVNAQYICYACLIDYVHVFSLTGTRRYRRTV